MPSDTVLIMGAENTAPPGMGNSPMSAGKKTSRSLHEPLGLAGPLHGVAQDQDKPDDGGQEQELILGQSQNAGLGDGDQAHAEKQPHGHPAHQDG